MSFPYLTDGVNAIFGTEWNLPLPTFGFLVALAILIATHVLRREVARQEAFGKLPPSTHAIVGDMTLVSIVAGVFGARVFHILDHTDEFLTDPASLIFSRSGFSIFGGLCFGVAAGVVFLRRRGVPIAPMLDATAPALMLGYAIGRVGCQIAGDGDWGRAADLTLKPDWLADWLWAQTYDGNIAGVTLALPGVYPTPVYESAMALLLFGVLWLLRSHRHRDGYLFAVYLLLAGFERLLIEKIRVNVYHDLFGVRLTQAEGVSLVLIVAGFVGVLATLRSRSSWSKAVFSFGVLLALSACAPF